MNVLEVIPEAGALHVTIINNPIDARDTTTLNIPLEKVSKLADVVGRPFDEVVFSINGDVVGSEEWGTARVRPGDFVVVCPILTGGGGSKSILRIAALVAVTYMSAGVASGAIGAGLFTSTSGALAAGAAISVAGGILVNAILPVQPLKSKAPETFKDSPSYSADAGNPTDQSSAIPIVYGTCAIKPVRLGFRTENVDQKTQDVYMLFGMSEGVIDGIEDDLLPPTYPEGTDENGESAADPADNTAADPGNALQIWVGDQPLRNFHSSDIYVSYTKGEIDQEGPEFFSEETKSQTSRSTGLEIGEWATFSTQAAVDRFEVEIANQNGLMFYAVNKSDEYQLDMRVDYDIEYKPQGAPASAYVPIYDENTVVMPGGNWQAYYDGIETPADLIVAGDRIKCRKATYARSGAVTYYEDIYFSSIVAMRADGYQNGEIQRFSGKWRKVGVAKQSAIVFYDLPHITDKTANPTRKSFKSPQLPLAVYDIRLRKRGAYSPAMCSKWRQNLGSSGNGKKEDMLAGAPDGFFYLPTPAKKFPELDEYPIKAGGGNGQDFYREKPPGGQLNFFGNLKVITVQHQATWASSGEILVIPFHYPSTALLSVRQRLTDRLSSIPTFTVALRGRKVKVYTRDDVTGAYSYTTKVSSSPAWITWDMLTHPDLGNMSESRLDLDKWYSWAKFCETAGLEFNGVFQATGNLWDAAQFVLRAGHAQLLTTGTRFSLAIERADNPVMMFNVGNIVQKSLKVSWLRSDERINEVEVKYYDKDDNYKESTIIVRDPNAQPTAQQRVHRLDGYWITNALQATREANFELNSNALITHSISFEAPVEAIACTIGDQILLQHDMPKWGFGGRLEAGSTPSQLKLDRPVTMVAGKVYKALLHYDTISQYTGTVAQRPGNATPTYTGSVVYLNSFDAAKPVKRLIIGGIEYAVAETLNNGGQYAVRLKNPLLVAVGAAYELKDTDTIIEAPVTLAVGDVTQISLATPLAAAPPVLTKWMFGEVDKVKRPYRIRSIAGTTDVRTIEASEYSAGVYNQDSVVIEAPIVPTPGISHIRELQYEYRTALMDAVYRPTVYFSWAKPAEGVYGGVDVYAALNSVDFKLVGQVRNGLQSFEFSNGSAGDTAKFKFIAVDVFGTSAPSLYAPTVTVELEGDKIAPEPPTEVEAKPQIKAIDVSWTKAEAPDLRATRIYRGLTSTFADAAALSDVDSEAFTDYPPDDAAYHYFLTSIDFAGNESDPAEVVSAAVKKVEATDIATGAVGSDAIAPGAINFTAFASTIAPVGLAASLPNPVGYTGPKVIYNMVDGKLYRYVDGQWTAAVEAVDLVGEIVSSQIANAAITAAQMADGVVDATKFAAGLTAIEIVYSLPTTDNFTGRSVYLVPEEKLYRYTEDGEWSAAISAVDLVGQISGDQIKDHAIDAAKLAAGAIDATKFAAGIEPNGIVNSLPNVVGYTGPKTVFLTTDAKLYRYTPTGWTTVVEAVDIDARGLDILDSSGNTIFGSDGLIGGSAYVNIAGTPVTLSALAAGALNPALNFVGEFASPPTEAQIGSAYRQNAVYKNTIDGRSYVLTGSPLGWVIYLESGTSFILSIESTNGTSFRPGSSQNTTLKARLFKNGAEVTDVTPEGWFRWRRVSGIPVSPPNDDATWNSLYVTGYKQISLNVDDVHARATFFCDILSP